MKSSSIFAPSAPCKIHRTGFEPVQLALFELESNPLDHSGIDATSVTPRSSKRRLYTVCICRARGGANRRVVRGRTHRTDREWNRCLEGGGG